MEQFKAVMKEKHIDHVAIGAKMGVSRANISCFFTKGRNLTVKTVERLAEAIGGTLEIKFTPEKTELELLREENAKLKKQIEAKRYVENGTLSKKHELAGVRI